MITGTEFWHMYSAVNDGSINAAEIIWFVCSGDNSPLSTPSSTVLTEDEAEQCYEMMCGRLCATYPGDQGGCVCTGHEHSAIREIYDLDFDQMINRDEFNNLVFDAEAYMIPWPHYIYIDGTPGECLKIATIALAEQEISQDLQVCCDQGSAANPQDDVLMLACPPILAGLDEPCETFNQGLNDYNPDCVSPLVCQSFDPAEPNGDKYCVDPASIDPV
jgi:hypothetical protein